MTIIHFKSEIDQFKNVLIRCRQSDKGIITTIDVIKLLKFDQFIYLNL